MALPFLNLLQTCVIKHLYEKGKLFCKISYKSPVYLKDYISVSKIILNNINWISLQLFNN